MACTISNEHMEILKPFLGADVDTVSTPYPMPPINRTSVFRCEDTRILVERTYGRFDLVPGVANMIVKTKFVHIHRFQCYKFYTGNIGPVNVTIGGRESHRIQNAMLILKIRDGKLDMVIREYCPSKLYCR